MPALILKKGSAKPLHAGHPWVFAAAVAKAEGNPQPGDDVRIIDDRGVCIGHALYSPTSAIVARLFTRGETPITAELLCRRIDDALLLRKDLLQLGRDTTAYRLVNSEGDGLPGLVVDVYGDVLSVQFGTVGIDRHREVILDHLQKILNPRAIIDRGDARIRGIEKLPPPLKTALRGELPTEPHKVLESGLSFWCDLRSGHGQKTGLFVDQRENRRAFASYAKGRDVLDLFSYSGGFAIHAAKAGAKSVTLADSSEDALKLAEQNLNENGLDDADLLCTEWTDALRHLREQKREFDLISVDPPKFARAQAPGSRSAFRLSRSEFASREAPAPRRDSVYVLLLRHGSARRIRARNRDGHQRGPTPSHLIRHSHRRSGPPRAPRVRTGQISEVSCAAAGLAWSGFQWGRHSCLPRKSAKPPDSRAVESLLVLAAAFFKECFLFRAQSVHPVLRNLFQNFVHASGCARIDAPRFERRLPRRLHIHRQRHRLFARSRKYLFRKIINRATLDDFQFRLRSENAPPTSETI